MPFAALGINARGRLSQQSLPSQGAAADTYGNAVRADNPFCYFRFNHTVDNEIASNDITLKLHGNPEPTYVSGLPKNLNGADGNGAVKFTRSTNPKKPEEITMPNNDFVNTNSDGHPARTIELWFRTDALYNSTDNHTIYEEGGGARGISIYVKRDVNAVVKLYAFIWNRPTKEDGWGTKTVDPEGLDCDIIDGQTYYFALVFNTANKDASGGPDPMYRAYIAPAWDYNVGNCGEAVHIGAVSGQDANWKSQVKLYKHGGGVSLGGVSGKTRYSGYDHGKISGTNPFYGVLDEFAMYDAALTRQQLDAHFMGGY